MGHTIHIHWLHFIILWSSCYPFARFTRFDSLKKQLEIARNKKTKLVTSMLILISLTINAQGFGVHSSSASDMKRLIPYLM
ncbi:MAG: hypothetical protein CM15mP36_13020 [Flavobacteriales bacterium]|nr:MAG: hypothetical protein CM15mP36_13020 [Flavobacteriales bacterium]